jgi:hypothetical protein
MNFNEAFPSKFLRACDLNGKPVVIEIELAPMEILGSGNDAIQKIVLHFRGGLKPLPLNKTNAYAVAKIAGNDTDEWAGTRVELYPTVTEVKGESVDCIRIRAPRQTRPAQPHIATAPAKSNGMNDDIPF